MVPPAPLRPIALLAIAFAVSCGSNGSNSQPSNSGPPLGDAAASGDGAVPSGCVPRTCTQQGIGCGPAGDGCGGALACGTCAAPQTCGGGGTPSECGSGSTCVPKTCAGLDDNCGPAGDGCGGSLDCGTCTAPQTCGGGGQPSVCGGGGQDSGGPALPDAGVGGDSWAGILAPSRAIDWGHAGLPPTLPDGETTPNPWTPPTRTQCGATIPSGASAATINAALAACAHGTYVLLGPGTFNISNANLTLYAQNGVTLRGSGPTQTTLSLTGNSQIQFGAAWNLGQCAWTAGYTPGTTSITTSSCTGPALVPGEIVFLEQCDTGYSGAGCTAGSSADNGGLYICGQNDVCQVAQEGTDPTQEAQKQAVYVTSVSGNTVNFSPGIYMPNWSGAQTPTINWTTGSSAGNQPTPYGNGLEDLTVYGSAVTANSTVALHLAYASWIKGVRFLGAGQYIAVSIQSTKNCLFMNNYVFSDIAIDSGYPAALQEGGSSDNLVINNLMTSGVPWEGIGSNEGNVHAFNYARDTFTAYYINQFFEHNGGSAFILFEGNQTGEMEEDVTHGTHTLNTWFRGYISGWDPPFQINDGAQRGVEWDAYARFENAVGNAIGTVGAPADGLLMNYQSNCATGGSCVPAAVFKFSAVINDPLTLASSLRWGNCDSVTGTCRFETSEVPTALTGGATSFENTVPSSHTLPASFFLPTGFHPSGGTGLNWWKVCTQWATFPTSCGMSRTQPFPPVGPDVTGGPYVNGTAYDVPAAIAFKNLPIDSAYQKSYAITSSSWANGEETLTVVGLPAGSVHIMGGFQVTGASPCNSPAAGEFQMTGSTATTISYAAASNPGNCASGTVKFPDVRQFDERVYMSDP
jgi:hypothetical protein